MSIFAWPNGWTIDRKIESVVGAIGMDPYDAALRLRKPPPFAIKAMNVEAAKDALRVFNKDGVTAFAPTQQHLDLVPRAVPAKALSPATGAPEPMWTCELWRRGDAPEASDGCTFGLFAAQIRLIIRAKIVDRIRGEVENSTSYNPNLHAGQPTHIRHADKVMTSDLIDLYCFDPALRGADGQDKRVSGWRRIRIGGEKFNFASLLGAQRSWTDNENVDRAAVALGEAARTAALDTGFRDFQPPLGMASDANVPGGGHRSSNRHLFEFYSAWVYIRERALGTLATRHE